MTHRTKDNRPTVQYRDGDPKAPRTPWGPAQHATEHAPGITFYSTAGHGGFYLSPARLAEMPEADRSLGWYEEDCEAVRVLVNFPAFFTTDDAMRAFYVQELQGKPCWNRNDRVTP